MRVSGINLILKDCPTNSYYPVNTRRRYNIYPTLSKRHFSYSVIQISTYGLGSEGSYETGWKPVIYPALKSLSRGGCSKQGAERTRTIIEPINTSHTTQISSYLVSEF